MSDVVVVGAGPNGLVAANLLADRGWSVTVVEANDEPGGAVRTAEVTAPGFRNDLFSAFYPLAVVSPALSGLRLEHHGLRWCRAPAVLAHPTPGGPTAVISPDLAETARSLDAFAAGDGEAWLELYGEWTRVGTPLVEALLTPFPPVRASTRLALRAGPTGLARLGRLALLSVARLARERFRGEGAALALTGNTMHTDIGPDGAGGALFGWLLASLAQQVGFPVPEGGAGALTDALVARLHARGGHLVLGTPVSGVEVRGGRAVGVVATDGTAFRASRAVVADVSAPALYLELVGLDLLPGRIAAGLRRFEHGEGTVKVDWAVSRPIPWVDPEVSRAGTVHLGDSVEALRACARQVGSGLVPADPFVIVGQMTTADPSRSPAGTESAWAYAHVPQAVRADAGGDQIRGEWDQRETEAFVGRMEEAIEAHAPGFREAVAARHVMGPRELEAADVNLVGGDVNGGTARLHQQLVLRPMPGLGRAETPIDRLFLASASAHPGGGVHGAGGANAARAAIARDRRTVTLFALGAVGLAGAWARRARRGPQEVRR